MEPLPDLLTLSDGDLDGLIDKLTEQEKKISYDRRTLHGKLDILRAERKARRKSGSVAHVSVEQLAGVLSRKTQPSR